MVIEKAEFYDLPEILSLQKLTFQSEAELCNDFSILPLTQTLESIEQDYENNVFLKATDEGNLIGSVRAFERDGTCFIGRLIVHPDYQNKGIGKSLMHRIEECFKSCKKYSLFTGERSLKNLNFYSKLGYSIIDKKVINENLTFVYFDKTNEAVQI